MANLNRLETGNIIYVNLGEDISTSTVFSLMIQPRIGDTLEPNQGSGVIIGTSDVDVGDQKYLANQYLQYTFKTGDLSVAGQWRIKAEAVLSSTKTLISDYEKFTVLE